MADTGLLERAKEAVGRFCTEGTTGEVRSWGNGHINDTFLVEGDTRYILQRMNRSIFTKPWEVMENITGVTSFLKEKIKKRAAMKDVRRLRLFSVRMGNQYMKITMGIIGACII